MNKNKRAVSLVLSYVLLILIAFSIATGVYIWIKNQVPDPVEACPKGLSIIVRDVECDSTTKTVNVTLANKGRFDIHGIIVRATDTTGSLPIPLNISDSEPNLADLGAVKEIIGPSPTASGNDPLESEEEQKYHFNYASIFSSNPVEVEVGAARIKDGEIYVCTKTFITTPISC